MILPQVLINALTGEVKFEQIGMSGNATYQELAMPESNRTIGKSEILEASSLLASIRLAVD